MSEISLQIDGRDVAATEDMSILAAARSAGISIPTVCHHEKLEPFGGCRLCTVEAEVRWQDEPGCSLCVPGPEGSGGQNPVRADR